MGKVTSIILDDRLDAFVSEQIDQGRFGSANEVVEAALRLLQKHAADIEAIRAAIIEGEESGEPVEFDNERFLQRMRQRHADRA